MKRYSDIWILIAMLTFRAFQPALCVAFRRCRELGAQKICSEGKSERPRRPGVVHRCGSLLSRGSFSPERVAVLMVFLEQKKGKGGRKGKGRQVGICQKCAQVMLLVSAKTSARLPRVCSVHPIEFQNWHSVPFLTLGTSRVFNERVSKVRT